MKIAAVEYAAPASLAEAIALLASRPGDAKALSGGQSLMPAMAYRLARPSLLVDLRKIPGLDGIDTGSAGVRLGARVRWRDIEVSAALRAAHPLLVAGTSHVAHYAIRNRGTVGGSLAHADPAAELPGIAVSCDAEVLIEGPAGGRSVPAGKFFVGVLSTTLADDELIVALRFPPWPAARRWGFEEFARRRGDFALAGIALHYDLDAEGRARDAHVGVIGACRSPHRIGAAEAVLNGRVLTADVMEEAGRAAAAAVDPTGDMHGSAAYRRSLAGTMLERALAQAAGREPRA
ncbi:MAG: xanthine dehydrogenase family protein subunit M [Betaproteobacteria bacterium]|nr:xanthine dehydrogenase family protein subunit M [Betaproteobacteria bacterium]